MKEKLLIGFIIVLVASVATIRILFKNNFENFKTSVSNYEKSLLETLREKKETKLQSLNSDDKVLSKLFLDNFDEKKAMHEQDTSYSFFYLSESIKYSAPIENYVECLSFKCIADKKNEDVLKLIEKRKIPLEKKYGEIFKTWFGKLGDEKIIPKTKIQETCTNCVGDIYEISYEEKRWNDFEKFLITFSKENKIAEYENQKTVNVYNSFVSNTKSQLKSNAIPILTDNLFLKKSYILKDESVSKTFNSDALGPIYYVLPKKVFDRDAFQEVANKAFEEQWKTNSLYNGAMPYANCFGANNYCDYYGCSRITVLTGSTDVLVTIKNQRADVIRHGYIKSGHTFSFNLPDGTYSVFFYSGRGWNPNKLMNSTSCGTLKGGFVSNEDVTKVDYKTLYNNEWTIELILQENGNLSTQPSSKNEAF